MQKGCQLLAEILHQVVTDYRDIGLQMVFVADGPFVRHFEEIVEIHGLHRRVAIRKFHEPFSRLGYAASDFILMPSSFEPCGLAQMIGMRYGSLPIVHATGGLRDTVTQLDPENDKGNGFLFEVHNAEGLRWAIDQAIDFHRLPEHVKQRNIRRVMTKAKGAFVPDNMTNKYLSMYQSLIPINS